MHQTGGNLAQEGPETCGSNVTVTIRFAVFLEPSRPRAHAPGAPGGPSQSDSGRATRDAHAEPAAVKPTELAGFQGLSDLISQVGNNAIIYIMSSNRGLAFPRSCRDADLRQVTVWPPLTVI